jgi:GNAT superfamily N-acetyltransferase
MRLVTYDELPESAEAGRQLVHYASFGGGFPRSEVATWRARSRALADYVGVFAVEGSEVVGQTYVQRRPYAFPDGEELLSAVVAVGTRPDRGHRGIAGRILEEVHRRERDAGLAHIALWTNRSWGAHRLYERLGYRDVYHPPSAVRAAAPRPPSSRIRGVGTAAPSEFAALGELHERFARGRLGFVRRPAGELGAAVATGDIDAAKELVVLRRRRRVAGYARVRRGRSLLQCGELVGRTPALADVLRRAVERIAPRIPIAFGNSVVGDRAAELRSEGYRTLGTNWYVLMGRSLDRELTASGAVREFGTRDPRFLCFSGDRF